MRHGEGRPQRDGLPDNKTRKKRKSFADADEQHERKKKLQSNRYGSENVTKKKSSWPQIGAKPMAFRFAHRRSQVLSNRDHETLHLDQHTQRT